MEAANWNGPNIQRTSTRLGAADRGVRAVREGALARAGDGRPGAGRDADDRAGGRAARWAGRSTSAGRGPTPATIRLRDERVERAARHRDPARRAGRRSSSGSSFGVADAADGLDVTVPHFRRDDVTREADLIEEVARIWGLREAPGHAAVAARRQRAARAASSGCGGGPRTRWSAPGSPRSLGWSFAAPELVGRSRIPADDPRSRVVRAAQPDVRGPVGAAHDAARLAARRRASATARAGSRTCGCSRYGAIYLDQPRAGASATAGRGSAGDAAADERQHLGALLTGRAAAGRRGARPSRRGADFFAAKGVLEARAGRAARAVDRRAGARAVPAPGPLRAGAGRRRARGLARRAAPGGRRARGTSSSVAGFELDLGVLPSTRRCTCRDYEDLTSFPAVRQDRARSVRAATCRPPTLVEVVREAGGALLRARRGLRRLPRARGPARRWRCGSSSARPTARSPTRRSRSGARRSSPRVSERLGGELRG